MTERLPASLAYLLIYNPTIPPPSNASKDDEDAQEEAHILFYTSRDRVASRDRMLRQVGLAKALVNFSEIFIPGQGCDNVHSQGKRMVSVSPEPEFWIHACVDLAKTLKSDKQKLKGSKVKDPPAPTYHYHEDSLHDLALRNHLLKGYEEFKLLHGTYTAMLKDNDLGGLQHSLERFFTPWAWKWDLESASEFGAHLGVSLHPLNSKLAPLISSFYKEIPSNATPLLLSPPYIIDPKQPSVVPYPSSLPAHLATLVPPPSHPSSRRQLSRRPDSLRSARSIIRNGSADAGTASNAFGFLSVANVSMGGVMNVKKWSWPGVLTFGKNGQASQTKQSSGVDPGAPENKTKEGVPEKPRSTRYTASSPLVDGLEINSQDGLTNGEGGGYQDALADAISSTNPPPSDQSQPAMEVNVSAKAEPSQQVATSPMVENPPLDTEVSSPPAAATLLSPESTLPRTGRHIFSIFSIFLSEPLASLVVQRRTVLHVSRFQLMLCLLMDAGWLADEADEHLGALSNKVSGFLEEVQQTMERASSPPEASGTPNTKAVPDRPRHIICPPQSIISPSAGFSSTSSQFFENQELLARDLDTIEIFSRSTTPQHWFVTRRGLGCNKTGEKLQGDAYLEACNKDASLVDADNELISTVRRWAHGENERLL